MAAWHLVFWVWGFFLLDWLHGRGVHWAEEFELPDPAQVRKNHRVGPKFSSWPNISTENPPERSQAGPTFGVGPTL
jgi:hypothetical protein